MKRNAIVFLAVGLLLLPLIANAAEKVLIYGDDGYPPYSYLDNDGKTPKGIYVEILRQAFTKMPEYEVEIKLYPWKRGLDMIQTGKGLAMFPPYFSEERESWMNLSEPILAERVMVFGTAEKLKGKSKWPEDFYGTKIGLNAGFNPLSMGGKGFAEAIKEGKLTLDEGKDTETCLKKLAAGRSDFYINDQLVDISAFPEIKRSEIEAIQNHGHLGFTRKAENFPYLVDFKTKFDKVIKDMKTSGEIDKIFNSAKK